MNVTSIEKTRTLAVLERFFVNCVFEMAQGKRSCGQRCSGRISQGAWRPETPLPLPFQVSTGPAPVPGRGSSLPPGEWGHGGPWAGGGHSVAGAGPTLPPSSPPAVGAKGPLSRIKCPGGIGGGIHSKKLQSSGESGAPSENLQTARPEGATSTQRRPGTPALFEREADRAPRRRRCHGLGNLGAHPPPPPRPAPPRRMC